MPEEEFETTEFKERLEEATERALEASEHRSRWVIYLSFTTAVIAVLAAIAALEKAVALQDDYADAYMALGDALQQRWQSQSPHPGTTAPEAYPLKTPPSMGQHR
jgi:hypothetical protein